MVALTSAEYTVGCTSYSKSMTETTRFRMHPAPSRTEHPVHWQTQQETYVAPSLTNARRTSTPTAWPGVHIVQLVCQAGREVKVLINGGLQTPGELDPRYPMVVCLVVESGAEAPVDPQVLMTHEWGVPGLPGGLSTNLRLARTPLVPVTMAAPVANCIVLPTPAEVSTETWMLEVITTQGVSNETKTTTRVLGGARRALEWLVGVMQDLARFLQEQGLPAKADPVWEQLPAATLQSVQVGMGLFAQDAGKGFEVELGGKPSQETRASLQFKPRQGTTLASRFKVQVDCAADASRKTLFAYERPLTAEFARPFLESAGALPQDLSAALATIRTLLTNNAANIDVTNTRDTILANVRPGGPADIFLRNAFDQTARPETTPASLLRILPHSLQYTSIQMQEEQPPEGTTQEVEKEFATLLSLIRGSVQSSLRNLRDRGALKLVQSYDVDAIPPDWFPLRREGEGLVRRAVADYVDSMVLSGLVPNDVALGLGAFVPDAFSMDLSVVGTRQDILKKLGLQLENESVAALAAFAEFVVYEVLAGTEQLQRSGSPSTERLRIRQNLIESAVLHAQQRSAAAANILRETVGRPARERLLPGAPEFLGRRGGLDALFALRHLPCWSLQTIPEASLWTSACARSATTFAESLARLGSRGLALSPVEFPFMPTQSLGFFPASVSGESIHVGVGSARLAHLQRSQMAVSQGKKTASGWDLMLQSAMQAVGRLFELSGMWLAPGQSRQDEKVVQGVALANVFLASSRPTLKFFSAQLPSSNYGDIADQLRLSDGPDVVESGMLVRSTWGARMLDREFVEAPDSSLPGLSDYLSKLSLGSVWTSGTKSFFVPYGIGMASPPGKTSNPIVSETRIWILPALRCLEKMTASRGQSAARVEVRLKELRRATPHSTSTSEFQHPYIVRMTRNADREVIEVPVVLGEAFLSPAFAAALRGMPGIRGAVEWVWSQEYAGFAGEVEGLADQVRATMFSIERIFQALQLVLTQAQTSLSHFPDVVFALPESVDEQHVMRMISIAFGALRSASSLQCRIVQATRAGVDLEEETWKAVEGMAEALQQQNVKVAPLSEVALLLVGARLL